MEVNFHLSRCHIVYIIYVPHASLYTSEGQKHHFLEFAHSKCDKQIEFPTTSLANTRMFTSSNYVPF